MSRRLRLGVGGVVGELDAAGLAAPAGQHLSLDDDGAADLFGRLARLLGSRREAPLRDGNPDPVEELLALVLVEIHRRRTLASRRRWSVQFLSRKRGDGVSSATAGRSPQATGLGS